MLSLTRNSHFMPLYPLSKDFNGKLYCGKGSLEFPIVLKKKSSNQIELTVNTFIIITLILFISKDLSDFGERRERLSDESKGETAIIRQTVSHPRPYFFYALTTPKAAAKMAFADKDTSLITILSSHHGQLRREQRDIDKRDLQRALKHGTRRRVWGQRWQVEFDGITFITDERMRREITAFPSPLPKMSIEFDVNEQNDKAKRLFEKKPELSTSHTVFVIDNSGSMLEKKNKIHLYRDCQQAAFSITALEFVAEQLFSGTAVNSDMVSLIIFSSSASIEFSHEPMGWVAYNKILAHRNKDKFVERQYSPHFDKLHAQSNYLPALDKAHELLQGLNHEKSALSLFFFSDGSPTDDQNKRISTENAEDLICKKLSAMANEFGESFTASIVGLGNPRDDFSILKNMAKAAKDAGAKASFEYCRRTANSMATAISSLVTSTTESRTSLMEGHRNGFTTRADLRSENDTAVKYDWQYFEIARHYVYSPYCRRTMPSARLPPGAVQANPRLAASRKQAGHKNPQFLAVNRNYFGKGAERVAFRCRLSDQKNAGGFVFDSLVAKETKDIERIKEKEDFHVEFMETQQQASYLAKEFNRRLMGLPFYRSGVTPQITFLWCSVLQLCDPDWEGGLRGVLVEQKLDTKRFPWTKWNDNSGMVDGVRKHMAVDVDFELRQLEKEFKAASLGAVTEEEEEESDGGSDDDESLSDLEEDVDRDEQKEENTHGDIKPSDYLQAFTHFTYFYTHRRAMVCDLQGVFNTDKVPPTFELTDPSIHYASARGRRMVYGRTDKGKSGQRSFLKTHKCTKICEFLKLCRKNKRWKDDWRQHGHGK